MKRGQSALEFLMTYGWAILIILVMIAALVYFGVFNPSRLTPERCSATPGFGCSDYQITETEGHFKIQNAKGDSLALTASPGAFTMNTSTAGCKCAHSVPDTTWASDELKTIDCTEAACDNVITAAKGDKQKVSVTGYYQPKGGGFTKSFNADVNSAVS